ncbi:MAG: hypothetical protein JSU05_12495 [Bacteroidetes bacterium]|nr:hypothetical protein [Bacteroidota bacterium]
MQKLILFFLATIIMTISTTGQTQKPADLADKIITAFKTKNFDSYKQLLIDTTDYKEMLQDYFKNNHIPETEKERLVKMGQQFADSCDTENRKQFDRLIRKGEKLGIDWAKIKESKFVFENGKPTNSDKKSLSGHLNFIYNDSAYVIFGIEATELSSGYKIEGIRTILKGGVEEYVDPDLLDDEDL